jgi:predicted enzyme related to lactoylglutathione lyase
MHAPAAAGLLILFLSGCAPAPHAPAQPSPATRTGTEPVFHGIYTAAYRVPDLDRAKEWYSQAFATAPYFDEPFYVGFNVGGWELGLQPEEGENRAGAGGAVAYWGVDDADRALSRLLELGAGRHSDVQDVGGGIRVATVTDPFGNVIGIIENPHFRPDPR